MNPAGSDPDDVCKTGVAGGLLGDLNFPLGIGTEPTGFFVYVADTNNHRVQKFNNLGGLIGAWGKDVVSSNAEMGFELCGTSATCKTGVAGFLGGEMNFPAGASTDSAGNLYVADRGNNRIQKFEAPGGTNFLRAWGRDVVSGGEHETAGDRAEICVNPAGSDPDDICQAGLDGSLGGEFISPGATTSDSAGNLYVADGANERVQSFDLSGNFQRAWGRNVVATGPGNTVDSGFEICVAGVDICGLGNAASALGGELDSPKGLASDAAGNLYVADTDNHRIQKFADPAPGGGGGGGAAAAAPSSAFTLGAVKGKVLSLTVSSAGEVKVADAAAASAAGPLAFAAALGLKPSSASGGPGTIQVKLKLTKSAKEKLGERGKVKVRAKITFTPAGGTGNTETAKLKIKR